MDKEIRRTLNQCDIKNDEINPKGRCLNGQHRLFLFLENLCLSTDETLRCFLSAESNVKSYISIAFIVPIGLLEFLNI